MYFLHLPTGRVVRFVAACGLRDRVGDPWSLGAIVRDGAVLRSVRMDQLIATEC